MSASKSALSATQKLYILGFRDIGRAGPGEIVIGHVKPPFDSEHNVVEAVENARGPLEELQFIHKKPQVIDKLDLPNLGLTSVTKIMHVFASLKWGTVAIRRLVLYRNNLDNSAVNCLAGHIRNNTRQILELHLSHNK